LLVYFFGHKFFIVFQQCSAISALHSSRNASELPSALSLYKVAPNLLNRDFPASRPNEKWVTDVMEFASFGVKLYLSPIIDLYNGEIISCSLSSRPNFAQTTDMLEMVLVKIPNDTNLIFYSVQGWQYKMKPFQRMLVEKGIRQSMSRKGNCLDNAVMENFIDYVKPELLYLMEFTSVAHFIDELNDYMEYYNHHRIKQKLTGLSPVQYRIQARASV